MLVCATVAYCLGNDLFARVSAKRDAIFFCLGTSTCICVSSVHVRGGALMGIGDMLSRGTPTDEIFLGQVL